MSRHQFSRRNFLWYTAAGFAALPALLPTTTHALANLPPLKIKDIKTIVLADRFIIVQVFTEQGLIGFGEASPMGHEVIVPIIRQLRELIVGEDPRNIERLWERMQVLTYKLEGRAVGIAISGVDIALWDILGKAANLPICSLLGGVYRDKIPVYATLFREGSAENVGRRAAAAIAAGFAAVKTQVATRYGFDAEPDDTVATVARIRKEIGDKPGLIVDANSGWTTATAIRRCREIEPYNIAWLEQPVPERDLGAVAEVCKATEIPMTFGEEEWNLWRYKDLLLLGGADGLQPDPIKSCGITGCKKVAVLAESFSKSCTPHNTSAHLGMAATVQLVASLPNARNPQEFTILPPEIGGIDLTQRRKVDFLSVDDRRKNDEQEVRQHLLTEPFRMVNSKLNVPLKPGLGIKLNPEIVKKHASAPVDLASLN